MDRNLNNQIITVRQRIQELKLDQGYVSTSKEKAAVAAKIGKTQARLETLLAQQAEEKKR